MRRFFIDRQNITIGSSVKLPDAEAEHIRASLRMRPGDQVVLFNGQNEYAARLTLASTQAVTAEIIAVLQSSNVSAAEIILFQGIIKLPNLELVLQKCTELGVSGFVPLQTEFSQIHNLNWENKYQRWKKIVMEACKQSERPTIPQLYDPLEFNELAKIVTDFDHIFLLTNPRQAINNIKPVEHFSAIAAQIQPGQKLGFLIGPEGGFSPTEYKLAADWQLQFLHLGNLVLRAETAAIATIATVQYVLCNTHP